MKVREISITKSLIQPELTESSYQTEISAEELIVFIARVSNPGNQMNFPTATGLLHYTIRNKHWSPFDMVNLCVEVTTSKAIGIQILRHWSIKPQEFSQRYAEVVDIEEVQLRKTGSTNRQSSTEEFDPKVRDNFKDEWVLSSEAVKRCNADSMGLYKELLNKGVAKECARMVLPMATSTTMYLNGSIRSWIHYLQQRLDPHAQLEHQQVAQEIEVIFKKHFPNVWEAIQLLKRDEDVLTQMKRFFTWAQENDWVQHGGFPGYWFNMIEGNGTLDGIIQHDWEYVFNLFKNDKHWHKINK